MTTTEARRRERLHDASMPRRLREHGREAYEHAQALGSNLEQAVDDIGGFLRENMERRPYMTLASAAGIGYVLGGGVPRRLTAILFGLSTRFAIELFVRELTGHGSPSGTTSAGASRAESDAVQRSFP